MNEEKQQMRRGRAGRQRQARVKPQEIRETSPELHCMVAKGNVSIDSSDSTCKMYV